MNNHFGKYTSRRTYGCSAFIRYLITIVMVGTCVLSSGCATGIYDGMRIADTTATIQPSGFVTSAPGSQSRIRIQSWNTLNREWMTVRDNIPISEDVAWTTQDNIQLYSWDTEAIQIPSEYWQRGTSGSYARVRVQWAPTDARWYNVYVSRADRLDCFLENYNGKGNTIQYMLDNCFSHRGEAHIYTANYREGSPDCPPPNTALSTTHGHYMIDSIPDCARTIISNRMREAIDERLILLHYEINHSSDNAASMNTLPDDSSNTCSIQPDANNLCDLGGLFGGHERYIQKMERHVMVYDYPWMPRGNIPAWAGDTIIPPQFRQAEVSPNGSCNSPLCSGWRSDAITNPNPRNTKPQELYADNVCTFPNTDAVASAVSPWHARGHSRTGGHFSTFDSPANPLFFLWHNAINDVWRDFRSCDKQS